MGGVYYHPRLYLVQQCLHPGPVKAALPEVKTVCGLSNISFGLPRRIHLNAAFLSMALAAGLDAAILDPSSQAMRTALLASEALLGRDEFCLSYIAGMRALMA